MSADLSLDDYDFALPESLIAQHPSERRDRSRLMVIDRASDGPPSHARFDALPGWLREGDLLVVNATRVLPARLRGRKRSGGVAEALLLGPLATSEGPGLDHTDRRDDGIEGERHRALVRSNGRLREGLELVFGPPGREIEAQIVALAGRGEVVLRFEPGVCPYDVGEAPLPPYIRRPDASDELRREDDIARYQTIYARVPGAVAAPTAGLHLTEDVLAALAAGGVERAEVVLHVGPGTFRPIGDAELASGRLHEESYELPEATAEAVAATRARGGRVVAVGTTSTRVLETCATPDRGVRAGRGTTDLFLHPGRGLGVVDALLTNFHLPRSSLLLLVAALLGRERLLDAYRDAIEEGYRFYSYGDAMLIV